MERELNGDKQTVSEVYAEAGEIIELPRKEAERLAGRSFEGYPTQRDNKWTPTSSGGATCGAAPALPDGLVRDPIVKLV